MEIEIKLCVDPCRAKALKAAVARGKSSQLRLVAHYFDAPDGRLAQARAALRVRLEGDRWVQTAKAIAQGPMVRLEHNVDLGPAVSAVVPMPDWHLHAGTPVGDLLAGLLQGQTLQPTHGTEIERTTRQVRSGSSLIELAFDQGRIMATDAGGQPRELPVAELELELLRGQLADLQALAERWLLRHGLWLDTRSKAERGEALRAGVAQWAPVPPNVWRFDAAADRPDGWVWQQRVLQAGLAHALPNLDAVASGHFGWPHVLHARQSLESLHWAARLLPPVFPDLDAARADAALTQALGMFAQCHADADGGLETRRPLDAALAERGLLSPADPSGAPMPAATRQALLFAVRQPELQLTLLGWMVRAAQMRPPNPGERANTARVPPEGLARSEDDALAAPETKPVSGKAIRQHLMGEAMRLHKRIRQSGKVWSHLTLGQRQRMRQRCWRLGLLLSWLSPLLGSGAQSRVHAYGQLLQRLHTALQAFSEATLAAQRAEGLPSSEAVWFERGYWQAELQWLSTLCERDLRRLKPFWD